MKKYFSFAAAGMLISCALLLGAHRQDKVWIIIRPVQCLGNSWEKDWLGAHNNEGGKYPRHNESPIIKGYFARKDVAVLDIRVQPYLKGEALCQTCDCPRGDKLFLLIVANDVPKMVKLGYTERMPAKDSDSRK